MTEMLNALFEPNILTPHGFCLLWQPGLIWLHLLSDAFTGLAYYSIPIALVYFIRRRRDLAFGWMFWLFAGFILACGTTHLFSIWTLWHADYGIEGVIKAMTALLSMLTAIALWPLIPKALALPSPRQLAEANEALRVEIGERRQAEAKLRVSEERYSGFFNHLAESLFVIAIHPDGRFLFEAINAAHARATGLDWATCAGRSLDEVLAPAVAERLAERYRACVTAGQPMDYEEILDLPVGRRTLHTVLVPMRDDGGQVVRLLGSSRDITERQRLQERLVQASKLATLGRMASGIAHEMSQPINIIRLWAEEGLAALRQGVADPARHEWIFGLIIEETARLGKLIDRMGPFSRRDSRAVESFDPAGPIRAAVEMVQAQYALENIDLSVHLDEAAAGCCVRGRPGHLKQVILDLLANARDAILAIPLHEALGGHIHVALRSHADPEAVVVEMTDTGGGIAEDLLPWLFDPFFTTKKAGRGTGLGLAVCHSLIDSMGGVITASNVELAPGLRGACLSILVPATHPSSQTATEAQPADVETIPHSDR